MGMATKIRSNKFIAALLITIVLFLNNAACMAQNNNLGDLRNQLQTIIAPCKATIGFAFKVLEDGDTLSINNGHEYPMQSVYKFPLSIAVLHEVDKGKLSLNRKIHIAKKDLRPNTWSPLREKYPDGNIDITVADLLSYTVSKSDNNACDILFKLMGGTKPVHQYIHSLAIKDIAITATEQEMTKGWNVQYTNWTKPYAMVNLLDAFYHKKYLSDSGSQFLMQLMIASENSPLRLKGLLPSGTIVAHKTGTSNTNHAGLRAAVNDLGIITLPDGKHIAIAVFVSNSTEKFENDEHIIAQIAKTVFDYFDKQPVFVTQIDSLIATKNKKPFNGVILIAQNGKPVYTKTIGYADLENKVPLQFNNQFIIGSISKQITAVLVLQELEKGHLRLDVPIRKYVPELKQPWVDTVTIYYLLTHMHGIAYLDSPLLFRVGTNFDYSHSNTSYNLLATIIERTSGKSFADLSMALFRKCGMNNTFHPDVKKYSALVKGYTEQPDGLLQFDSMSFQNSAAAGSFVSTASDLVLWNEYLHNGKLLDARTYAMMTTKQKNAIRQHPTFGITYYGLGITIDDKDGMVQLGQTGFAPGFASMDFYFPQTKTSVIVLENTTYDMQDLKQTFKYHISILNAIKANK